MKISPQNEAMKALWRAERAQREGWVVDRTPAPKPALSKPAPAPKPKNGNDLLKTLLIMFGIILSGFLMAAMWPDEKKAARQREEMNRTIWLSCRANSVTEEQAGACYVLGRRR